MFGALPGTRFRLLYFSLTLCTQYSVVVFFDRLTASALENTCAAELSALCVFLLLDFTGLDEE
jgi:hypothetical protein